MRYDLRTFSIFIDDIREILTQYKKTGTKPKLLESFLNTHKKIGVVAAPSIDAILNTSSKNEVFQSNVLASLFFILDLNLAFHGIDGIILISNSDCLSRIKLKNSFEDMRKSDANLVYNFIRSGILGESSEIIFDGYNVLKKNGYDVDVDYDDIHLDNTGYFVCVNQNIIPEAYRFSLQFRQMKNIELLLPFVIAGFSKQLDFTVQHGTSVTQRLVNSLRATPVKETRNMLRLLTLNDVIFESYTYEPNNIMRLDKMERTLNRANLAITERVSSTIIIDFSDEQKPYAEKAISAMWDCVLAMIIWRNGLKNVPVSLDLTKRNNNIQAFNDIAKAVGIEAVIHAVFAYGVSLADIMPEAVQDNTDDIVPSWWFNIFTLSISKKFAEEIKTACPDVLRKFFFPEDAKIIS